MNLSTERSLVAPSLIGAGNGIAFRVFVLKLASRCDLDCDYCYLYHMADATFRSMPRFMSLTVAKQIALRIAEHARIHYLTAVDIALHGGEPLLAGEKHIAQICAILREAMPSGTVCRISLQTNGVSLVKPGVLDILANHDIAVGVSLDGDRAANDRHRLRPGGDSSFEAVDAGLRLLGSSAFRRLFAGILSVVDLDNDPLATHAWLSSYQPPWVDYLWPHGNWTKPPPGRTNDSSATPYADWTLRLYDTPPDAAPVRILSDVIALLAKMRGGADAIGFSTGPVVLEGNGAIERVDTWRSAYAGASQLKRPLNVFDHPIDAVSTAPEVVERILGLQGLCRTCRACPVVEVCGGGYQPHRYKEGSGSKNPSVYCADLLKLIQVSRHLLQGTVDSLAIGG